MYTYQQRLEYIQRLHELTVIKSNIHLTYKYKNRNKAISKAQSLQDKIINSIIDDAVYGNSSSVKNIDKTIQELMYTTLENERKRIHRQDSREVTRAVELNAEKYSSILSNRINTEAIKLKAKIESEMASGIHNGLSEQATKQNLKETYGDTAKARIKNIIQDSVHTNESNISFIKALNDGYNYKVWMNGRSKGKTRRWHVAKYISPVPIDEYFTITGGPYGTKNSMYPGDLYSGAENVANCKCWLRYTNNRPEGMGKKQTVFNIPSSSYLNNQNNKSLNADIEKVVAKPIETIKTSISNTTKKVTSKIKDNFKIFKNRVNPKSNFIPNPNKKIKNVINNTKNLLKENHNISNKREYSFKNIKSKLINRQISVKDIDTKIHSKSIFKFNENKLKKQLRESLPKDFSDDAITYIIKTLSKRGNAQYEFGQIFKYDTGKAVSIEFGGDSYEYVDICNKGPYKNKNNMTSEEYIYYIQNRDKLEINYIEGKSNLATQHNHTDKGLYPPSTSDFLKLLTDDWADYSICISRKEIWVIEHKGKFSLPNYRIIEDKIGEIERKVKNCKKSKKEKNKWYGNEITKVIKTLDLNIKIYTVII